MNKYTENARTRIEGLKAEALAAIESGKFASCPADAEGITPQTRLEWVAPSIDYINGVAAGLPEKDIDDALAGVKTSDEDELMFAYVAVIEAITKDQYVTEGKYNLTKGLDILDGDSSDSDDSSSDSDEALFEKVKSFFGGKKKSKPAKDKTPPKKTRGGDSGDKTADECRELKQRVAKLEADKADSDARADAAEAEVRSLKAKLKDLGVIT